MNNTHQVRRRGNNSRQAGRGIAQRGLESLESRLLLSESATAQVNLVAVGGTPGSPLYTYSLTLTDTGTTSVGTFWFAWVPGEDFLASKPSGVVNPAGWTDTITGSDSQTDGSAIQWVASTGTIAAGDSLGGFEFTTADAPAALMGDSPTHAGTPAMTSFVYSGAPFSDAGAQLVATFEPAGAATSLKFLDQPETTLAGLALPTNVVVDVTDQNGNVVTGENANLSLSITGKPAGSSLTGTTIVGVLNGAAVFDNLTISPPGFYTLSASAGSLTGASTSFNISPSGFAQLLGNALTITGTAGDDTITLTGDGVNLTASLNGVAAVPVPLTQVTSIDIEAGAGNDSVTLGASVPGASVQGGLGDDTIQGGPGNDTLGGGQGADVILGGPGDDSIRGGAGDDILGGGQGADVILGSLGNDTLTGGLGNDTLIGGAGANEVRGGQGDDTIFAINNTADTLFGGLGNDTAHIDQGLDQIPNSDIEVLLFS